MEEEDIKREIELENKYNAIYNQDGNLFAFPREWYSIKDYRIKGDLLEEALEKNVPVGELETFRIIHEQDLEERINRNIEKSVQDIINKKK